VTYAVIPAKGFQGAKQRLAAILHPEERRQLAKAMLTDTLLACGQSRLLAGFAVVTCDPTVAEVAATCEADVIWEPKAGGHSQAVTYAVTICLQRGKSSLLTLPADLPLITSDDIDAIVSLADPKTAVLLVPNRDEMGTNAILLSPPDCLPLQFGYDSFQRHLRLAAERQLRVDIRRYPRVALDIDEPEDLALFAAQPSNSFSYRLLDALDILPRLAKQGASRTQENYP
jgi:2-phospho-L-lactate guanylyltransferase